MIDQRETSEAERVGIRLGAAAELETELARASARAWDDAHRVPERCPRCHNPIGGLDHVKRCGRGPV